MSDQQAMELSKQLRKLEPKLDHWLKVNRGSIWDGPAKLLAQFAKLVLPVTYVLGLLLFSVLVTDPTKLPWMDKEETEEHTAYVDLKGAILTGNEADADRLIPAMEKALEAEGSEALVVRINSPGGSPVQSDRMYQAIQEFREEYGKPIYSVIEDIGASGAYYVAAGTDGIYANRSSMIGSIGVISSSFGFTELMDKLGVERRTFTAGDNKDMLDPFHKVSPAIEDHWNNILASTHETFIERVKEGRGDVLAENEPDLFSGLIWDAQSALDLGLIDGMGSLRSIASELVGAEELVDYTPPKPFKGFSGGLGISAEGIEQAMVGSFSRIQESLFTPSLSATP
ncbi:S49 family peptidase [Halomonas sp. I5-271120]|uniref:S49 family peptidase n=1 Tax=Halomonas sp. I5-271120 TaxID=3061632 RepID=UPI0027155B6A|nr:S49 family peptidase [Halomonas sp. I5-271120]